MRIALIGYGGMGHEVEKVLKERGHVVSMRVDPTQKDADGPELTEKAAQQTDMAIQFSHPEAVIENIRACAALGVSVVCGTTGWYGKIDEARAIVEKGRIGFIYGSNFSVGAHLFFALVAAATELSNPCPEYDIMGWEVHHRRKKDSPSGTALTLARIVTGKSARKKKVVTERLDRAPAPEEMHMASVRGGEVPGTHTVLLDSPFDTIELTHRARSRGGFALGSVRAAEWMVGRKGFYEVNDFISAILQGRGT